MKVEYSDLVVIKEPNGDIKYGVYTREATDAEILTSLNAGEGSQMRRVNISPIELGNYFREKKSFCRYGREEKVQDVLLSIQIQIGFYDEHF